MFGATKNSLNATKRIIQKAHVEPKLLNLELCCYVATKLPHKGIFDGLKFFLKYIKKASSLI